VNQTIFKSLNLLVGARRFETSDPLAPHAGALQVLRYARRARIIGEEGGAGKRLSRARTRFISGRMGNGPVHQIGSGMRSISSTGSPGDHPGVAGEHGGHQGPTQADMPVATIEHLPSMSLPSSSSACRQTIAAWSAISGAGFEFAEIQMVEIRCEFEVAAGVGEKPNARRPAP